MVTRDSQVDVRPRRLRPDAHGRVATGHRRPVERTGQTIANGKAGFGIVGFDRSVESSRLAFGRFQCRKSKTLQPDLFSCLRETEITVKRSARLAPLHLNASSAAVRVPDGENRDVGRGDDYDAPSGAPGR